MRLTTFCINGEVQASPPPLRAPASQSSQRIALHQLPELCSGQYALTWRWHKSGTNEDFLKFRIM